MKPETATDEGRIHGLVLQALHVCARDAVICVDCGSEVATVHYDVRTDVWLCRDCFGALPESTL